MENIWKYCTKKHINDFILSLNLLDGSDIEKGQALSCLYSVSRNIKGHYKKMEIKKHGGGKRIIYMPDGILKLIQKNICKNILSGIKISQAATAYSKGSDILQNAKPHCGKDTIVKLDISDFFGSISFSAVLNDVFKKEIFPLPAAILLTNLCCLNDSLVQGAPTSAMISNIVMRDFDLEVSTWCGQRDIIYTRYSDDMTFSGEFDFVELNVFITPLLMKYGFSLNKSKTAVLNKSRRRRITGVVINDKPQASKGYRRKLRQDIFLFEKHDVTDLFDIPGGDSDTFSRLHCLQKLLGRINHVLFLNPDDIYFTDARTRLSALLSNAV